MNETLATLLKMIVEIVQNHSKRLTTLESDESTEDGDDASLMQEISNLLARLQAQSVPSDQM